MGNSRRYLPSTARDTAMFLPSGPQSTLSTPSSNSLGAPPESGTLANVPPHSPQFMRQCNAIASSPLEEIENSPALMPRARDSGASVVVVNNSTGFPAQD